MTDKQKIDFAFNWVDTHKDDLGFTPANFLQFGEDYVDWLKASQSKELEENQRKLLLGFCEFMYGGSYDSHNTTHSQDVDAYLCN